ncbi:RNA chaperone Hfq [Venenivibrio stagnispumantis]|uniref:RNA-binding protein Hfq n=1 Tax=Venenivibrio stagnispumantis TaxID=407998 RepID=A0AA46AFZ5_9AQUI|nr:RNA chaperone Hfq [Venenivibrio stagnispumantis]MCW4573076.1 RNA chaperone Hfq [Venenivibrio stagnispumantis]SMP23060.1 host factor-I protein [Venenivibrio stagnispumantis]
MPSVQDELLEEYRKEQKEVTVYLIRGTRIVGKIIDADQFTILLDVGGQQQLIYKHAISTIVVES